MVNTGQQGESDLYKIDRRADSENLQYDSVYSGNVSVYRRKFDCLGLRSNQKLKWADGRSKLNRKKRKLETDVRYFKGSTRQPSGEILIPREEKAPGISPRLDFVRIKSSEMKLSSGEKDSNRHSAEWHMSQLTGQYNRSLLEQPHSVELWLEFLAFQDQFLEWGHLPGQAGDSTGHKTRALLDRKIAIYERALEHNPTSEELLIGHMSLVWEVWTTEKVIKRWKDLVFRQPNRPRLWLSYLHYCQTNFSSFGTTSLISLFRKCLTTLSSIEQGTLKSHPALPDTMSYLLAIFSLFCDFLKQVGLTERALACYQALIEYNLCTPSELSEDEKSLKGFFETFWDSGCPRFGEARALGWCNWMKEKTSKSASVSPLGVLPAAVVCQAEKEVVPENTEDIELGIISGLPLTEAWLKLEDHRMIHNCFPWQSEEAAGGEGDVAAGGEGGGMEEECSDPDRMVTFDDVSQTLFRVSEVEMKVKLVLSFLNFLGAPVESQFHHLLSSATNLHYLQEISPLPVLDSHGVGNSPRGLGLPFLLSPETTLAKFAGSFSERVLEDGGSHEIDTRTSALRNFICNVCNHSLTLFSSTEEQTEIIKVWMSFLLQHHLSTIISQPELPTKQRKAEVKWIQKLFKSLLRLDQHRNNLPLWNCYALFESSVGNLKEARSLYQSLLAQYPCPDVSLCCSLCECVMGLRTPLGHEEVDSNLALHALVCLAEGKNSPVGPSVSPGRILKARSHFIQVAASVSPPGCVNTVFCHSYFEYLTRGVTEASTVLARWAERLKLKEIHLKQVQLLEYHSRRHPLQPAVLRQALEKALEAFPGDDQLMAAFIRSEQQTFISGRMRRHFDKVSPASKTPLPWLFAVAAEMDRYVRVTGRVGVAGGVEETSVGTVHRIRSLLGRAASSENARHCPLLWRIYLLVQVRGRSSGQRGQM